MTHETFERLASKAMGDDVSWVSQAESPPGIRVLDPCDVDTRRYHLATSVARATPTRHDPLSRVGNGLFVAPARTLVVERHADLVEAFRSAFPEIATTPRAVAAEIEPTEDFRSLVELCNVLNLLGHERHG